jgi:YbgC/YbaW family acyl-CoA thioester hydrolase
MELKTFYKIRFTDCDSFKHLHNSGYIDYMLNAREDHLAQFHNLKMTELYAKGLGWMVSGHEIIYLKPAVYDEQVCIQSALIKAQDDTLLVEMVMYNEQQTHIKAILHTKFTHVSLATGRRDNHPDWFMQLALGFEDKSLQQFGSMKERLAALLK